MNTLSIAPSRSHRLALLAICSGLGVANVYYLQPGLWLVQSEFGVSAQQVGWLPSITQVSYALGMLLLAPLGDIVSPRRLIVVKSGLLVAALVFAGASHSLDVLVAASAVVGLLGSVGQDFVPVAAQGASETTRGRAMGTVTMGLLTGILLSRTLGGLVSQACGWRSMQFVAAALMALVALVTWRTLPDSASVSRLRYAGLLASLWTFWRQHRSLRLAVSVQAAVAMTLGGFWSCLALVLAASPFHLGAGVAGSFGIAGAMGALASRQFGHLADRKGPLPAIRIGCLLVVAAFVALLALPPSLWALAAAAVLFDTGVMATLVSNQSIVNGLDKQARSRLNGLLMTGAMIGTAAGAAIGAFAWSQAGAAGLFGFCAVAGASAFAISLLHRASEDSRHV